MNVDILFTWLMVLLRSMGVVMLLPTLGSRPAPVMVRVALSVCLATLVSGVVPTGHMPLTHWALVQAAFHEVVLGLAMGFVGRMTFAAVEMAGRVITTEIGLNAAPGMGVPEPSHEPLAAFLSIFAGLMFFLVGGHLMAITAFAKSFQIGAPGQAAFYAGTPEFLITRSAHVIELGLRMAAPFIGLNFLVTLAFSVLSRAVPKMNVFILSYSLRLLAGFALLAGAGALITRYLFVEFSDMPLDMLQVMARR